MVDETFGLTFKAGLEQCVDLRSGMREIQLVVGDKIDDSARQFVIMVGYFNGSCRSVGEP